MTALPPPPLADRLASPLLTLTDELLEEIFLRLPNPIDLARASAACVSFRGIITHRSFLHRHRAIHPPPLLGFVAADAFHAAEPPHSSAPLARAVGGGADFSYSFVPMGQWLRPWRARDARQGRVLLQCLPKYDQRYQFSKVVFLTDLELVVCDPLFRRYVLLPRIPAQHGRLVDFDAFLAPTGQDEEHTSFKVICTARNEANLFAFFFSSITGNWCLAASPSWSSLGIEVPSYLGLAHPDYAFGCFYWAGNLVGKLLMLDTGKMEFSVINNVPSSYIIRDTTSIVAGAEGTPILCFVEPGEDDSSDLLHITKLNNTEPSDPEQSEKIIPLARQCMHAICGGADGFLFLRCISKGQDPAGLQNVQHIEYFSLDVKTSEFKKFCEMKRRFLSVHAYFASPLSLFKPSI